MLKELLLKNRSTRSFDKNVKIDKSELYEMVDCTRYCPSSANLQALKFICVNDDETCNKIFSATRWAGYLSKMEIPPKGHEPTAYIIVLHDKTIAPDPVPFYKDCGIASHTILLRACEMGYSGCMIGSFDKNIINDVLSVSDDHVITLVLAIGKGDEECIICDKEDSVKYFREGPVHFVPKRSLEEIIIK